MVPIPSFADDVPDLCDGETSVKLVRFEVSPRQTQPNANARHRNIAIAFLTHWLSMFVNSRELLARFPLFSSFLVISLFVAEAI